MDNDRNRKLLVVSNSISSQWRFSSITLYDIENFQSSILAMVENSYLASSVCLSL